MKYRDGWMGSFLLNLPLLRKLNGGHHAPCPMISTNSVNVVQLNATSGKGYIICETPSHVLNHSWHMFLVQPSIPTMISIPPLDLEHHPDQNVNQMHVIQGCRILLVSQAPLLEGYTESYKARRDASGSHRQLHVYGTAVHAVLSSRGRQPIRCGSIDHERRRSDSGVRQTWVSSAH